MRLVWTPEAVADLEQLLAYIAERSPEAAATVAARIRHSEQTLFQLPAAGHLDLDTGVREWVVPHIPLLVIYQHSHDLIEIIALFHTSRKPERKRRL